MKKAQITPFMIIGIIILIAASFFFYYRNAIMGEFDIVPEDVKPIKNYIEDCLEKTGEDAVIRLGMQGGYIDVPDEIRLAEAYVELIPRSSVRIPYWYYNDLNFIPSIGSMETQISNYIENNLDKCVNLGVFQFEYEIEADNQIIVETSIAKNDVDLKMDYKLVIRDKTTGDETEISEYHASLPVKLKQVYELGIKILEAENSKTYFENMTVDWVAMNPKIPLNGLEFHCGELKWGVEEIKRRLQDMIYYNLPKVKVKNTNYQGFEEDSSVYERLKKYDVGDINKGNLPDIEAPEDAYDYSHYVIDARTTKTELKAGFVYNPDWGMDMVVRPSENGIMRSSKQSASEEFLSFICLNFYHFTYDIVYPIEVLVRDDKSFNGKGYVFRYAFPVMINHNQADREGFFNPEFIMLGSGLTGECDDLDGEEYDIRALGVDDYGIANMELKNINISYDCYKFRCSLGKTKADEGAYRLRTQLPSSCSHGFIVAEKEGYLRGREQVLDSVDVDVSIKKLKTFDFEVVMNDYDPANNRVGEDRTVKEPFIAVVDFQSVDEPSLSFFRKFPFDENTEDETIDLIEQNSRYKVDIILFDGADGVFVGGYKGEWRLNYNDIANNNKIIFHAASYMPKPLSKDAEQDVFKFLEENKEYKTKLEPELK